MKPHKIILDKIPRGERSAAPLGELHRIVPAASRGVLVNSFVTAFLIISLMPAARADCPGINEIIKAFADNGSAPKGWQLNTYAGKKIDKGFHFQQASWYSSGTVNFDVGGNVVCEYGSKNKANPGFIIVQTNNFVAAPTDPAWQIVSKNPKKMLCKSPGNPNACRFK